MCPRLRRIDASRDEALGAKAQLQIGICYEKLGLREAEKAFRLVVEKYPRQNQTVEQAKDRLNRLAALAAGPASATSGGLSLRKLDMPVGAPSPDGKYLAVHDDGDDLYLYEIETKRKTLIKSSSVETGFLMYTVSWAPDGRQLAYIWRAPKHFNELWIWIMGAAEPRLVCQDLQADLGNIAGWSPDQSWIYVQYYEKQRSAGFPKALGRISAASGRLEKICALDKSQFNMRLSPDGKYLAFNVDPTPQDHEIRIVTADGQKQSVLWKHQGNDIFLTWTPDGKSIIYASVNIGQKELWRLGLENGLPAGPPKSIHLFGANVESVWPTRTGALFIKTALSGQDACTAQIDLNSGELIRPVQVIEPETLGWTSSPFWSADGGALAYFYQKDDDLTTRFRFDHLKIKSIATGRVDEYRLDFLADPASGPLPRWSADGKTIFVLGKKNDALGLVAYDLGKKMSRILLEDRDIAAFAADGKVVYLDRTTGKKPTEAFDTLLRKDLLTGTESVIYSCSVGEGIGRVRLSGDASMIGFYSVAFMDMESAGVFVIPAAPERTLTKKDARFFRGTVFFDWGPAGKGILVRRQVTVENRLTLQLAYFPEVDPALNPIPIDLAAFWSTLAFHPDGKTIAFTQATKRGEFWSLTNYLPRK
ncbi:MAG: hypothetical protein NTZ26_11860 [Candidatus Aminicenantes bacterium]|nr:hypothetical protein [Candidatus Aminicenantes bacterium]